VRLEVLSKGGLYIPRPKTALNLGISVLEQAATFNREFWEQTGDLIIPKRTPRQFVRELRMFAPLHDAEVGFSALEAGERKDDPELIFFGGAMAVKAMVHAYEEPEVPSFVTREIVGGVIEHHIVPEEQPLLSDELVERSEPPINKYGRTVLDLFPSIENKL
jgi:hypothetical protein